jgi:hypothetical protein
MQAEKAGACGRARQVSCAPWDWYFYNGPRDILSVTLLKLEFWFPAVIFKVAGLTRLVSCCKSSSSCSSAIAKLVQKNTCVRHNLSPCAEMTM